MAAQIYLFPCLKDNFGVLIHDPESGATAAIDVPEAAPVEAALHDMAQWQAKGSPELNSSDRAGSAVAHRLRRIAAMAVPLIKALDENQRRSMMMLARSAGLEQLLASK